MEPITFEAYATAYQRMVNCLTKNDIDFTEHGFDPRRGRFMWTVAPNDKLEAKGIIPGDDCYDQEFADADQRWQLRSDPAHEKAQFDGTLAYLESIGLTNIPDDIRNGHLGMLLTYANKTLDRDVTWDVQTNVLDHIPPRAGVPEDLQRGMDAG